MPAPSRRLVTAAVLGALALTLPGLPAVAAPSTSASAAVVAPDFTVEKTGGITQLSDTLQAEATGSVLYDSRSVGGALKANQSRTLDLFSGSPLTAPADATAVILNVTAVSSTSSGWLTVWPSDKTRPTASTLNFAPGTPTPNLAVVQLTASRQLKVMNGSGGTTHVLVSFRGWVRDNGGDQRPGSLTPTDATRVVDTRQTGPAVPAHGFRDVTVTGVGAPDGATAALLDVIAVKPTRAGYLIAHPSDTARPTSTALTYRIGGDRAALSLMRLSASGKVRVWNMSSAPVHLVIDSFGWVAAGDSSDTPAATAAISPVRVLDTRASTGPLSPASPFVQVPVPGDDKAQSDGRPSGVVLAITATAGTSGGHLDLDVGVSATALTPSIVNFGKGETVTNTTYVVVPTSGRLRLHASTGGSVHAIVDVVGLVRHRTEIAGRVVTEAGGDPVNPGLVALSPSGSYIADTAADGTYRATANTYGASNACGRVALPSGGPDPAYALACVGGNTAPTQMPVAVGAKVLAADIRVPRVGAASGLVTSPTGTSPSGANIVLRRTDNAYAVSVFASSNGRWTAPAVPVGTYVVTVNGVLGLAGETIDELPASIAPLTSAQQQQRLDNLVAAGAKTFTVTAGSTVGVDDASLLSPGVLKADVVDPDGSLANVTTTWRTETGYVVSTGTAVASSSRTLRPGSYTVCVTEGAVTVCSGGASTWQTATPVVVESGVTATTTLTLP
jgi:hypothetical protein